MTKKNWLRILMVFVCLTLVCSFALAQTYTLTYTFTNHPFGTESYTAQYEAGAAVTLDIPVGESAGRDGNVARLTSWTEINVPEGAEAVAFDVSEPDDWGCQRKDHPLPRPGVGRYL